MVDIKKYRTGIDFIIIIFYRPGYAQTLVQSIKKYVHNQSISSPLQEIINKKILEEQKKINSSLVPVANLSSSFLEKNRQLI